MFSYDAGLLAALRTPVQSVSDVIQTMQTIEDTCLNGDGLKWFNWMYLEVTRAVEQRVIAGRFTDPAWLVELDLQFARLYFAALESALSGQPTAGCWRILFERRDEAEI